MGTRLRVEAEGRARAELEGAVEAALAAVQDCEARWSTWVAGSELQWLNRAPLGRRVAIDSRLARGLRLVRALSKRSRGAFEPGIASLVEAWGLRTGGRLPSSDEVATALAKSGLRGLEVGEDWACRHRDVRVEEGGFAKGLALDAALRAARASASAARASTSCGQSGASRAGFAHSDARDGLAHSDARDEFPHSDAREGAASFFFDFGGQLLASGCSVDVAIADPRQRSRALLRLRLTNASLATSGNSERGIVVDGRRLGHLIDPRSGQPAPDFGSLSVIARDAVTADALSTGLYVLGPARALAFANAADDVEVVVIERASQSPAVGVGATSPRERESAGRGVHANESAGRGVHANHTARLRASAGLRVRASEGLRGRLSAFAPGVTIEFCARVDTSSTGTHGARDSSYSTRAGPRSSSRKTSNSSTHQSLR